MGGRIEREGNKMMPIIRGGNTEKDTRREAEGPGETHREQSTLVAKAENPSPAQLR